MTTKCKVLNMLYFKYFELLIDSKNVLICKGIIPKMLFYCYCRIAVQSPKKIAI